MKKFFVTLSAVLIMTCATFAEAASFTQPQLDKIFLEAEQSPATSATLNINAATLTEKFNGIVTPILKEALGTDDISAMAHLFLIKDAKIFSKADGDTFANIFGDYRVALVGLSEPNGGNFKNLRMYYTTPEGNDESIFTIWLLTAFVKSIAPDVNVQDLMNELTAENSSGTAVKGNLKFSVAEDGNLNVLTATPAQ